MEREREKARKNGQVIDLEFGLDFGGGGGGWTDAAMGEAEDSL
jgi:hypothetical protein